MSLRPSVVLKMKINKIPKDYLQTLTKPELIAIILKLQKKLNKYKKNNKPYSPIATIINQHHNNNNYINNSNYPPSTKLPVKKSTERMATDYDKIAKQRAVIKALKEKKKLEKKEYDNILRARNANRSKALYNNPHDKKAKVIKATERMGTDYNKIEKQRIAIRALKEKQRLQKLNHQNTLKQRNAHRTNNLFADPHEKVIKHKDIKHDDDKNKNKNKNDNNNKDKIMDPISAKIDQQRQDIEKALNDIHHDGNDLDNAQMNNSDIDNNTIITNDDIVGIDDVIIGDDIVLSDHELDDDDDGDDYDADDYDADDD